MASAALAIPVSGVEIENADTRRTPFEQATTSSRTTMYLGNALRRALTDLRSVLAERLRKQGHPEVEPETLRLVGDTVVAGGAAVPLAEIVDGGSRALTIRGVYESSGAVFASEAGACGVEVAVDVETGKVEVLRCVSAIDTGAALNPPRAHGQNLGAAVFALGATLTEQLRYDADGQLQNGTLFDYTVPHVEDAPHRFESILLEDHGGEGPDGARGIGEAGGLPFAAAVANAIYDATGIQCCDLPITPGRLADLIAAREESHR
jgi:CO/xanthine dehydrogenase Mo-binding subunit